MFNAFYPLQIAVLESGNVFWQSFFGELAFQQQATPEDLVREEVLNLQVEASGVTIDDPRLGDILLRNGAAVRAYLAQCGVPILSEEYWKRRPEIVEDLKVFIRKFGVFQTRVATAACIPRRRWRAGEYSHDLSQVLAGDARLFHLVEHLPQIGRMTQQAAATELAPQVLAAHEERARNSKQLQAQMQ